MVVMRFIQLMEMKLRMNRKKQKNSDDILKEKYMTPQDLKIVIPTMSLKKCRETIDELRTSMEQDGYYVPQGKVKIALTEFVVDRFFKGKC